MGAIYKCVTQMPYVGTFTGGQEALTTLYFRWTGFVDPGPADFNHVRDLIRDFYTTAPSGHNPIYIYMSSILSNDTSAVSEIWYKMPPALGPTGPPVFENNWSLNPPGAGGTDLPSQLAIALSFHGPLSDISEHGAGGTRPRSRRRGRIYLGPWNALALGTGLSGGQRPINALLIETITDRASAKLRTVSTFGWEWVVFSKKNWDYSIIDGGWVDVRWDIVRRRADAIRNKVFWGDSV